MSGKVPESVQQNSQLASVSEEEVFILLQGGYRSIHIGTVIQDEDNLPYALSRSGADPRASYRTGN